MFKSCLCSGGHVAFVSDEIPYVCAGVTPWKTYYIKEIGENDREGRNRPIAFVT